MGWRHLRRLRHPALLTTASTPPHGMAASPAPTSPRSDHHRLDTSTWDGGISGAYVTPLCSPPPRHLHMGWRHLPRLRHPALITTASTPPHGMAASPAPTSPRSAHHRLDTSTWDGGISRAYVTPL